MFISWIIIPLYFFVWFRFKTASVCLTGNTQRTPTTALVCIHYKDIGPSHARAQIAEQKWGGNSLFHILIVTNVRAHLRPEAPALNEARAASRKRTHQKHMRRAECIRVQRALLLMLG